MISCIVSEHIKFKRTFIKKLAIIAPIFTILIAALLQAGTAYIEQGSYNYWYTIIFPGILPLVCAGVIKKDSKKLKNRAILCLPFDPAEAWVSKILVCMWFSFLSCGIFFIVITFAKFSRINEIPILNSIEASLLIFITTLWQIPLCLFIADSLGSVSALLINFIFTVIGVSFSPAIGIAFPYSTTSLLMCPIINVLPSGLHTPANSPLKNSSIILPGIIITVALFIVLSILTSLWFRKREAK